LAGHSVLLIDAGEDHGADRQVQVPALHIISTDYDPMRWDYFVSHYDNEAQAKRDSKMTYRTPDGGRYTGLNPPQGSEMLGVLYPRAGGLGGCASHNALVTVLPNDEDWNYIASVTGDKSWGAANMLKYFVKLERVRYLQGQIRPGHGNDGWLSTQLTPVVLIAQDLKVASLVLAAAAAMGKGLLGKLVNLVTGVTQILAGDINSNDPIRDKVDRIYQVPASMDGDNYTRSSPRDFVMSVATAKNPDGSKKYKLDIALNTLVTKINFDTSGSSPKATGVDYLTGKNLYRASSMADTSGDGGVKGSIRASREVIVSAGAFNTPQLLKLSGIGPAEELKKFDIPVVKNLPGVGGNMQDRFEVGVVGKAPTKFSLLKPCKFLEGDDPCYNNWKNGVGMLKGAYTTNGIAFGFFHHSSVAEGAPDLFIGGVPAFFDGYWPGYNVHAIEDVSYWSWLTLKAKSRSRAGTVNLTSADPRDMPRISFRSNLASKEGEKDLQAIYEGIQYSIRAFDSLIPLDGRFDRVWPPREISSEKQLKQWAKDEAWGHHASCTAPIGAANDPMAVLDSEFRVRGVQGLRVVDASVFPRIPGTYISLPIYMVSEKAADVIIASAKKA
jgi:choline dehydrogenase